MKSPYRFPLRSRAAIVDSICDRGRFRWERAGRLRLAWNIKVYRFDETGHAGAAASDEEITLRPDLDAAWAEECERNHNLFWEACGDALGQYLDGDWTRYPGEGKHTFYTDGRSGGWLILDTWDGPMPWAPRGRALAWDSPEDLREWLQGLDWPWLRRFYATVATLDHDLKRRVAELEYQIARRREAWEEERERDEETEARTIEAGRPDMYGAAA